MPQDRIETLLLSADLLEEPDQTHRAKAERLAALLDERACVLTEYPADEIAAEYLRLFSIGARQRHTVLYAGWWRDGRLQGPTCRRIETFYAQHGYRLDPAVSLPADHLSVMLRFLSILIEEDDRVSAEAFSRFLTWVNDFAGALERTSVLCSYPMAARAAERIINTVHHDGNA